MRAIVKTGPGSDAVIVTDVPEPTPKPGQVRVRVNAAGICGTDLHIAHDEYGYEAPVVMGHEVEGVVDIVGDPSDEPWVGRRVACETYLSACEVCESCRAGRRNLCVNRRSIGSYENGGFAEYVIVPTINLHALPDYLGEHEGALLEPLACVTHLLLDPPVINAGDRVLVTGPGAMGQLAAQVAKACGAEVVLSGLPADAARLEVASRLGITTTTGPIGDAEFDVVAECSGSAGGAAVCLRAAKRSGRYIQVGIFGREPAIPADLILYKELTVTSGFASTPTSWNRAIRLVELRAVDLAPLVTTRTSIEDFTTALASVGHGAGIKTVVIPAAR